jgi:GntR family transcriptional regulator
MADGNSPQAPYLRVAAALRARVADGTWPVGHRLPSRPDLGREHGVGENVVRRAQELLVAQGVLEGRAGSGTYVRAPHPRCTMLRTRADRRGDLGNFCSALDSRGVHGTWESDSEAKVPAPPEIAARLGVDPGSACVRTTYEFLADRRPVMLSTSWEPMSVTGGTIAVLPEGGPLAGRGVVARMAEIGVLVTRAVEVPHPVRIDRGQAQLLGTAPGLPAILIERTHYDEGGRPVETADILMPAERWQIAYEMRLSE